MNCRLPKYQVFCTESTHKMGWRHSTLLGVVAGLTSPLMIWLRPSHRIIEKYLLGLMTSLLENDRVRTRLSYLL